MNRGFIQLFGGLCYNKMTPGRCSSMFYLAKKKKEKQSHHPLARRDKQQRNSSVSLTASRLVPCINKISAKPSGWYLRIPENSQHWNSELSSSNHAVVPCLKFCEVIIPLPNLTLWHTETENTKHCWMLSLKSFFENNHTDFSGLINPHSLKLENSTTWNYSVKQLSLELMIKLLDFNRRLELKRSPRLNDYTFARISPIDRWDLNNTMGKC